MRNEGLLRMGSRVGVRVSAAAAAAGSARQYVWALHRMGRLPGRLVGREIVLDLPPVIEYVRARGREVPAAWLAAAGEAPTPPPNGGALAPQDLARHIDALARSLASALEELQRRERPTPSGGTR